MMAAADHLALNLDQVVEFKQWKLQHNWLIFGDRSLRADEHTGGADIFNDIAKHTFSNCVFGNDESSSAGRLALIGRPILWHGQNISNHSRFGICP